MPNESTTTCMPTPLLQQTAAGRETFSVWLRCHSPTIYRRDLSRHRQPNGCFGVRHYGDLSPQPQWYRCGTVFGIAGSNRASAINAVTHDLLTGRFRNPGQGVSGPAFFGYRLVRSEERRQCASPVPSLAFLAIPSDPEHSIAIDWRQRVTRVDSSKLST